MGALEKIKEYAKSISFEVVDNSYNSTTQKIKVICPNNHTTEVNYKNWKTAVNKCQSCPIVIKPREKLSYDDVKKIFSDDNFELLSTEYLGIAQKLEYKCSCGEINCSSLNNFKKMTYGCKKCAYILIGKQFMCQYSDVLEAFNKMGYKMSWNKQEFDEKYKNMSTPINFVCDNGHENTTTMLSLNNNHGCSICSGNKKLTYEFVKAEFEKRNFTMVSTVYVNARTKIDVICDKGHKLTMTYDGFSQGSQCVHCLGSAKHEYTNVKKSFEDENYILLSTEYINAHKHLQFICPKNHTHYISYTHWMSGKRCGLCAESKGEIAVRKFLVDNKYPFVAECRFDDCKDQKCLPFDFYVDKRFIIEFDGIQHFGEYDFFGGADGYKDRLKKDKIKTDYCVTNKIPLLRIAHSDIDNIPTIIEKFIEDIKTSSQIVYYSNPDLYKTNTQCYIEPPAAEPDEKPIKVKKTKTNKKPKS